MVEQPGREEEAVVRAASGKTAAGQGVAAATSEVGEEQRIQSELGIGSPKIEADKQVIDQLLEEAVVGYEDIFSAAHAEPEDQATPNAGRSRAADEPSLDDNLSLLRDVHMKVKVELGRGQMYLKDILRLGQGSVVELERLAGDPLDIYVNDKIIARGEVLVLNENFCIRITEICDPADIIRHS